MLERPRSRASSLTPRTSFLVFMCLAAGAAEPVAAATERLGELRTQEQEIRELITEVDEQIQQTVQTEAHRADKKHTLMLAGLKSEYRQRLADLARARRQEESKQHTVSVHRLLDVHFVESVTRGPLLNVRFMGATDEGGLEMLRFAAHDGSRTWVVDPSAIDGIRASDSLEDVG